MTPTQRATEALLAAAHAHRADDSDLCVTFELPDDPEGRWIQVTWNHLNMSYPAAMPPAERIALPPTMAIVAWEKERYVTLSHSGGADAVSFLVGYAEHILRQPLDERWARDEMTL